MHFACRERVKNSQFTMYNQFLYILLEKKDAKILNSQCKIDICVLHLKANAKFCNSQYIINFCAPCL